MRNFIIGVIVGLGIAYVADNNIFNKIKDKAVQTEIEITEDGVTRTESLD